MKRFIYTANIVLLLLFSAVVYGQSGVIEGRVYNSATNEPIPFSTLIITGTTIGSVSDLDGNFIFTGIEPGYVSITATTVGFEDYISEKFLLTNANKSYIEIPMNEAQVSLDEVVVRASPFRKKQESPVSLRRIGIEQIEKNPGGNRDISKVIQSFPGVASTPAFRNDIIVRGGGPSENSFYLDGVEIPNLNHFATQGASGGPVGIINVDFIREVNFYSGAFPANTSNAMSSVLDMRQIDGNKDKLKFRGSVGASDLALTLDGPLGENTTFIASARQSYLQFLFSVLGLPFLPTYNDFQVKTRTKIDDKNEITFIALGAIDQFRLNEFDDPTLEQKYILSYLPVNEQWNYTNGLVYKHFRSNGFDTWVLSRNFLRNTAYKYPDNNEEAKKIFDLESDEIENNFRYERTVNLKDKLKVNFGTDVSYAKYLNSTRTSIFANNTSEIISYETNAKMFNYAVFGQVSKPFLNNRLSTSIGLRADASTISESMSNPLNQISPRLSLSYLISEEFSINANTGRYYQRPPYTAIGFKNNNDEYVNLNNGLSYIASNHFVAGVEYRPNDNSQLVMEGFYKGYTDYPFSIKDSVPLATKGADFGTFGDEELLSISNGRAYGFELLARSEDIFGFNAVLSYTFVRSEFEDLRAGFEGEYLPTSWDNRHLLNITGTQTFKNGWFFGFKWRFVGGAPYTPWDIEKSSIKAAWDIRGQGYLDYSRFNEKRLKSFHQLDVRVDKQFFFDNWSLNLYVDSQNLYNFKADQPTLLIRESFDPDYAGSDISTDGTNYLLRELDNQSTGTVLPTLGIIVEF